jgi:multiple sugar transport system permease protein
MAISTTQLPGELANRPGRVGLKRVLGPDYRMAYLFITPIALLVLSLVAYPFTYAIYLSMTFKLVGLPPVFVGFENYIASPGTASSSAPVVNSFIFTFGSVGFKLVLGVVMALVLTSNIRWRSFWTGVLLIPWVAPTVVSALNFLWIFDGSLGVLNYVLVARAPRLPQGVGWLLRARHWPWPRWSRSTSGAAFRSSASRSWPG